jgi:hypothetical protein
MSAVRHFLLVPGEFVMDGRRPGDEAVRLSALLHSTAIVPTAGWVGSRRNRWRRTGLERASIRIGANAFAVDSTRRRSRRERRCDFVRSRFGIRQGKARSECRGRVQYGHSPDGRHFIIGHEITRKRRSPGNHDAPAAMSWRFVRALRTATKSRLPRKVHIEPFPGRVSRTTG